MIKDHCLQWITMGCANQCLPMGPHLRGTDTGLTAARRICLGATPRILFVIVIIVVVMPFIRIFHGLIVFEVRPFGRPCAPFQARETPKQ